MKKNLLPRSVTCVIYHHLLRRMCVTRLIHSGSSTSMSSASTDSTDLRWKISGEKFQKFPKNWTWICCTGNSLLLPFSHSVVSDSATPWTAARQASLSITTSRSLFKLMSIESVMPSNHFILCHPLLLLPSIFPSIRDFPMSQFFTSGGQSIRVSASASVLPMNIQDWFPLGWTVWISLQFKGLSRVFSNTTFQKRQFFFFLIYSF